MGIIGRLLAAAGQGSRQREAPTQSGAQLARDWPEAVTRPSALPDPDASFDVEGAPSSVVGVLQWTSELLVDGGRGPGSWDYIDVPGWATGDMSGVVSNLGTQDSDPGDLERAVCDALGRTVTFTPGTWLFSRQDSKTWWTSPLFVVHRRD